MSPWQLLQNFCTEVDANKKYIVTAALIIALIALKFAGSRMFWTTVAGSAGLCSISYIVSNWFGA